MPATFSKSARRDAWSRRRGGASAIDVVELGFKYNPSDVAAAVGLGQFPRLKEFLGRRAELVALYRRELTGLQALQLPPASAGTSRHAWNMFTPLILVEELRCNRATVMAELKTRNIGSAVHYPPVHTFQAYAACGNDRPGNLAVAEYAGARILTLPLFPAMTADDVHDVAAALYDILTRHRH